MQCICLALCMPALDPTSFMPHSYILTTLPMYASNKPPLVDFNRLATVAYRPSTRIWLFTVERSSMHANMVYSCCKHTVGQAVHQLTSKVALMLLLLLSRTPWPRRPSNRQ